jgi:hypothetical protein
VIEVWDEIAAMQRWMDDLVREFPGARAHLSCPARAAVPAAPFLPGIDPEKDVTVTLEEGQLVIQGERL